MSVQVDGLSSVLAQLNAQVEGIEGRTRMGLRSAALLVQRESQKLVPIDSGNLKASAYTRPTFSISDSNFGVEVGYTAAYALFVHESVGQKLKGQKRTSGSKRGSYWDTGQPKFLETAVNENFGAILDRIRRHARVK